MDKKIISLVLILICIFWLYFEMHKLKKTKEGFEQENLYFTREEPYKFTNLLSTLNTFKEKSIQYSTILQNLQIEKLAKSYEQASNEAVDEAVDEAEDEAVDEAEDVS